MVVSWWLGGWEDKGERKGLQLDEIPLGVRGFSIF